MKIAVIGAGFAGLSSAKILRQFDHEVTVYEKAPDVGGVWSRTRRYPGLRTQNNKGTYYLSDFPMPRDYPEWPSGEQVQAYLANYARHFGLDECIHLNTEVVSAEPVGENGENGWTLTVKHLQSDETRQQRVDQLVVANGIFSQPFIPPYEGAQALRDAGGVLCATSEFHDVEQARGKHVLVVGYGKSSCDVAAAVGEVAASTRVIARSLLWKLPRKLMNLINFKYAVLTRLGEGLFPYIEQRGFERFLHGRGRGLRDGMIKSLQNVATRQLHLKELDLVPEGTFDRIARSTVSLATDELYEHVRQGKTQVLRECSITRLGVQNNKPVAWLSNGQTVAADVIICGTGWQQGVPFLPQDVQARLFDEKGNFKLYRQIFPLHVPNLYFCGYNSSFYSPLNAEAAAWWIASHLMGDIRLPPTIECEAHIKKRLAWMFERTEGKHARGTNLIPFSMHNVDEILSDVGLDVSKLTRLKQWLMPIQARDYQRINQGLLARHRAGK